MTLNLENLAQNLISIENIHEKFFGLKKFYIIFKSQKFQFPNKNNKRQKELLENLITDCLKCGKINISDTSFYIAEIMNNSNLFKNKKKEIMNFYNLSASKNNNEALLYLYIQLIK